MFFAYRYSQFLIHTNTGKKEIMLLPEVGLMGLHLLVARPRPRWRTSDSELLWEREMKLTVR